MTEVGEGVTRVRRKAIDPDVAETSEAAAQSRQGLFDKLVTVAVDTEEIKRSLEQAHGIDERYLHDRCKAESARLWDEVTPAAHAYVDAARHLDRVAGLHPVVAGVRGVLTSTPLQHSGALVGLLLVMFAWVLGYAPGSMEVFPNYSLLAVAMSLVAFALATRLPAFESRVLRSDWMRHAVDVFVVPGMSLAAIVVSCLAVADLIPPDAMERAKVSSQWSEAALLIMMLIGLVAVPFARTIKEIWRTEPVPAPSVPSWVIREPSPYAAKNVLMVLGAVLAGFYWLTNNGEDVPALVFGMPNWVLLYAGLGVTALAALTALLGFPLRPARLIRQAYQSERGRVSRELTETAILPFLRAEINKHTQVPDVVIDVREAPGLGQLSDPAYLVSTAAAARVGKLLESMPGGSIGLAGARGSGKTTLIESYCAGPRRPARSLATMVSAPVEYSPREFLLHLYAKLCHQVIGPGSDAAGLDVVAAVRRRRGRLKLLVFGLLSIVLGAALVVLHNAGVRISAQIAWALILVVLGVVLIGSMAGTRDRPVRMSGRALSDIAAARLEEIRFQQSFSSNWSGAVKVPLGLEGTIGGGRGLTRQPLHLPEIIDSLREFLELAAREHRVLIGIDELDKMESETAAEQFLNEIKSIFGVRGCYFLVSVSEDAMSSFERRGLPFRDVFDSTFDEIVWFEHLTTAQAIASIDRRVLLMPLPFKQLCFALSGGLPRDLIRAARLVIDAQDPNRPTGLSQIATHLVAQDVARKARAISVAVRRIDLEPDVGRFLLLCAGARDVPVDAGTLTGLVDQLLPTPESRAHLESTTAAAGAFLKLAGELACFLYYAATVLEYFDETAGEARWLDSSALHLLAQARQAFHDQHPGRMGGHLHLPKLLEHDGGRVPLGAPTSARHITPTITTMTTTSPSPRGPPATPPEQPPWSFEATRHGWDRGSMTIRSPNGPCPGPVTSLPVRQRR